MARSCFYCNTYKGPNLSGWNAEEDAVVRLYHTHEGPLVRPFQWNGLVLEGMTRIGIATVMVLRIKHPDAVAVRQQLRIPIPQSRGVKPV